MLFASCHVAEKLEAAMKAMVVTVAKHLEKAQQSLAARIADTFTILWYTSWSNCVLHLASSISRRLLRFAYFIVIFHLPGCIATVTQPAKALPAQPLTGFLQCSIVWLPSACPMLTAKTGHRYSGLYACEPGKRDV